MKQNHMLPPLIPVHPVLPDPIPRDLPDPLKRLRARWEPRILTRAECRVQIELVDGEGVASDH